LDPDALVTVSQPIAMEELRALAATKFGSLVKGVVDLRRELTAGNRSRGVDDPAVRAAFWSNAYNLFTLRAIVDHYPIRGSLFSLGPRNSIRQIRGVWFEAAARRYLASPLGLVVDGKTVSVSSVFKWYGDDFIVQYRDRGPAQGSDSDRAILGVVATFGPAPAATLARSGKARVRFLDYDWSLNDVTRESRLR
jgi:hypothetical protein